MQEAITVRPAREDDLEDVARISTEAYAAAGQLDPGSAYGDVLADAAARRDSAVLLVAERAGRIVGTVTICPEGSPFAEIGRHGEVEFRFLAVDPAAWRSGVADALIEACEDQARSAHAERLAICVRDTNTGAAEMYERRGFTRMPDRDWTPVPGVNLHALRRDVLPSD